MNLQKLLFTNNNCYKTGKTITPKGIMVHSTGANNPNLKRYVGPNDGKLGANTGNNHWNQATPDGRQVCVHAFIGKLADGSIATYQTLPWNYRGWHCGSGSKGSGNDTHISFEICEDALTDSSYFGKVYQEAVDLCVYLCKQYGLNESNIICHSEGYSQGIASNHADVMHWFPKHGKSMSTFRSAVKAALGTSSGSSVGSSSGSDNTASSGTLAAGSKVTLSGTKMYSSATTSTAAGTKTGTFYLYDGKLISGRYRITNSVANVGKTPIASYVTGWINASDISGLSSGNSSSSGSHQVRVKISDLNIRKGPGTNYVKTGKYTGVGTFTIVETQSGQGSTAGWGRLKSGAGWISLDYAAKV